MDSRSAKILGDNIKRLRKTKNLTQQNLAAGVDISVNHLSLIENGRVWTSSSTLDRFQEVLDVDLSEFFLERESLDTENRGQLLQLGDMLRAVGKEFGMEITVTKDSAETSSPSSNEKTTG